MKLYYHKTTGGAEYLCSNYVVCPNGDREGTFRSAYIVRIDGNIERDWERATRELQMDYTEVDFDGVTYWIR